MKTGSNTSLEFVRKTWESIIDYEKSWYKTNHLQTVPVQKLLHYFGAENICKLYGCTVVDEEIARILIVKEFVK